MENTILSVRNLSVQYETEEGIMKAVNDVSFELQRGETLGLVGETGAGKTTIALAIMGLLPVPPAVVTGGSIEVEGEDVLKKSEKQLRRLRGNVMSMIFQDPMTALNPTDFVGDQIREVILLHEKISKAEAAQKAADVLEMVGIPRERYMEYAHQFSGGMRQRVVIAIALACNPSLLIADEPTTALDVTIQAQILQLIEKLKAEKGTSNILITHDLGIIARMCDRVAIVYAGEIIELGSLRQVFKHFAHPYTKGLFDALPDIGAKKERLHPIPGSTPDPADLPNWCRFYARCAYRQDACKKGMIPLMEVEKGHCVRCLRPLDGKGEAG